MELNYDYLLKIIIIGDSGIGKSAILFRFADDIYNDNYISTIGVDFKIKTIFINGKMIKLQIWDTAGQERFRTITTSYYRGSHMIFLCYDITDRESFTNLDMWLSEIKNLASGNVRVIVCGTKLDLAHKRQVSKQEGQTFADTHRFDYYETSAKQNKNIEELFEKSSEKMLSNFLSILNNNSNNSNNSNNLIITKKQIISRNNTISIGTRNFKDELQKKCCI
jgi:Ras-related protein Rab-1A